jgi:glycine oxidase
MPTQLDKNRSYDVVVIGAGVIGLATGWRASRRGMRTLVLDAGEAARGATHVAAGMLAPVTEASFGEDDLIALNLEAARRYPAFIEELEQETGTATAYRPCGTLAVALDRDDAELLAQMHEFHRSRGLDSEWLRGRECRALEPALSPSVVAGFRSTIDHQVSPRLLAKVLTGALRRAGGELREWTPVAAVTIAGDHVTGVELQNGEQVEADQVVVAAGWQSSELGGLPESARVPLRPVKGQILRLRGDGRAPLAGRVIGTPEVYLVPRADGRLIVGATVEERGADTTVTAGAVFELLRSAYEVLPGVAELELGEASAGLRPAAPDNMPIVGSGALTGLVWATAHWRNGILLASVTADAVVALLVGEPLPGLLHPFSPHRFSGASAAMGGVTP